MAREDWSSAHKLIDIMTEADQEIPDWLVDMAERYKAYRERMRGDFIAIYIENLCRLQSFAGVGTCQAMLPVFD